MVEDLRRDRDEWREQAKRLALTAEQKPAMPAPAAEARMVGVVAVDRLMPGSHSGKNSGAPDPRFL
jgi:hypothetical protein